MYSSSVSGWKHAEIIFVDIVGNKMHEIYFSMQTVLHFDLIFLCIGKVLADSRKTTAECKSNNKLKRKDIQTIFIQHRDQLSIRLKEKLQKG